MRVEIDMRIHIYTIKLAPGSNLTLFCVAVTNESQFFILSRSTAATACLSFRFCA